MFFKYCDENFYIKKKLGQDQLLLKTKESMTEKKTGSAISTTGLNQSSLSKYRVGLPL